MNYKFIIICILLLPPLSVIAHEGEEHGLDFSQFEKAAGTLPGEFGYLFERLGEWVEVNLLTVSTKAKQQKYLEFTDERLAELVALVIQPNKASALSEALDRYQYQLERSREMAEVIVWLDGAELALAKEFERKTLEHEELLAQLPVAGVASQALITARVENKNIFTFMVEKYQFTDEDIREYGDIVRKHIGLVENSEHQKIRELILKAEDHLNEGLNLRAYEIVEEAKNLLYANLNF